MKAQDYRLWYDNPAMTWTQALPVGNGVVGGMVFGQPAVEHIQLNEETIWAGQPNNVVNPEAKKYLPQVQQLILEGKYREAQDLANAKVMPMLRGKTWECPISPSAISIYQWLDMQTIRTMNDGSISAPHGLWSAIHRVVCAISVKCLLPLAAPQ